MCLTEGRNRFNKLRATRVLPMTPVRFNDAARLNVDRYGRPSFLRNAPTDTGLQLSLEYTADRVH